MFEITLITMGKLKEKFYISAAEEYKKRLSGYCRFQLIELPEYRLDQVASDKAGSTSNQYPHNPANPF